MYKENIFSSYIVSKYELKLANFTFYEPTGLKVDRATEEHRIAKPISTVLCFPLFGILSALGNPPVDYFSLDVEGAELAILNTIPWGNVDIKVTRL